MTYQRVSINAVTKLAVDGAIDLPASQALLQAVARDTQLHDHGLLIDIRTCQGDLTYRDIHQLVQVLADHPDEFTNRLALLDEYTERFEKDQFFEAYATELGFSVRAFVDEDAAVVWLEEGEGNG